MKSCVGVESGWCPIGPVEGDGLAVHVKGCHYDDPLDAFHTGVLGFCGCGDPEATTDDILDYLRLLKKRHDDNTEPGNRWPNGSAAWSGNTDAIHARFPDERYLHLIEYVADAVDLTEHGGSCAGGWLTDGGELWLSLVGIQKESNQP